MNEVADSRAGWRDPPPPHMDDRMIVEIRASRRRLDIERSAVLRPLEVAIARVEAYYRAFDEELLVMREEVIAHRLHTLAVNRGHLKAGGVISSLGAPQWPDPGDDYEI